MTSMRPVRCTSSVQVDRQTSFLLASSDRDDSRARSHRGLEQPAELGGEHPRVTRAQRLDGCSEGDDASVKSASATVQITDQVRRRYVSPRT